MGVVVMEVLWKGVLAQSGAGRWAQAEMELCPQQSHSDFPSCILFHLPSFQVASVTAWSPVGWVTPTVAHLSWVCGIGERELALTGGHPLRWPNLAPSLEKCKMLSSPACPVYDGQPPIPDYPPHTTARSTRLGNDGFIGLYPQPGKVHPVKRQKYTCDRPLSRSLTLPWTTITIKTVL